MPASSLTGAERQRLNALCEQGARSAAHALALFLGAPEPQVRLSSAEAMSYRELLARVGGEGRVLSVGFGIAGAVSGVLGLFVGEDDALILLEGLVPGVRRRRALDERALAAFSEVGNILASAFLNEVASTLRTSCIPSVPSLVHDDAEGALQRAVALDTTGLGGALDRPCWRVTARLSRGDEDFAVQLVVMPGEASIERLVEAHRG